MGGDEEKHEAFEEIAIQLSIIICNFAAMIAKRLIGIIVVGAVVLLAGCSGDKAKMLQQLEQLEQQNRSGEAMLNDSLAESLVNYFDRHGDANERMRSRYILLSRIHAQSAVIFNLQVQPRSQLDELRMAEYYAWRGKDTLQAIECYAQQSNVYYLLHNPDSVILIKEDASRMYGEIGREDRAAKTLSSAITMLIEKGDIVRAGKFCNLYETRSGLFDEDKNIVSGREIYYYAKGRLLLAVHQLDSAEYFFRKELRVGKDLNNQIAGCKGLQKLLHTNLTILLIPCLRCRTFRSFRPLTIITIRSNWQKKKPTMPAMLI